MGILDKFKKSGADLSAARDNSSAAAIRLSEATAELNRVKKQDVDLKNYFVGKLFRGKLIEDIFIGVLGDGGKVVVFTGRVLTVDEYYGNKNSFDELVEKDDWVSGALAVFGGKVDVNYWGKFLNSVSSGPDGVELRDSNVSANRTLVSTRVNNVVNSSISFGRSERVVLNKILVDEFGLDLYIAPRFKLAAENRHSFESAFDMVVDVINVGLSNLDESVVWYDRFTVEARDALLPVVVRAAESAVEDIVLGK